MEVIEEEDLEEEIEEGVVVSEEVIEIEEAVVDSEEVIEIEEAVVDLEEVTEIEEVEVDLEEETEIEVEDLEDMVIDVIDTFYFKLITIQFSFN